jgi:hypothetical protein
MNSWQDEVNKFKAKNDSYDGAAATLILMFLSIAGEDYPTNIANEFSEGLKKETGWNEEHLDQLRSLKDPNQVSVLLRKMRSRKLVVGRREGKTPLGKYRYYRVNPEICIQSPRGKPCLIHRKRFEEEFYLAADFLVNLMKDDYDSYFRLWSQLKVFDFITFLMFLKDEAERMNNGRMELILSSQMSNEERKDHMERRRISESEKEKRQIKWDDELK